jgi:hypothetical protein
MIRVEMFVDPVVAQETYLQMVSLWPSNNHPHRACLPYELWEHIFLIYCYDSGIGITGFNAARYELCDKFGWWSTFIRNNSVFWTRIYVDFFTRPSSVARHIANVGSMMLSVEIDLDLSLAAVPGQRFHLSVFQNIIPSLSLLSIISLQWRSLLIYINGGYFLVPILLILNSLDVRNLEIFHFQCPFLSGGVGFQDFDPPPPLFGGRTPSLRHLTLTSATVPWTADFCSSLVNLDLVHLPMSVWPSSSDLICALTASPALERLVICGSGVSIVSDPQPFTLPSLTHLTIVYGASSVIRFLASANLPSIYTLVLSKFNELLLDMLVERLGFLSKIAFLTIDGGYYADSRVDVLMRSFRNIRSLCTVHCGAYFAWLVNHVPDTCTLLEELIVGDVSLPSLFMYIHSRGGIRRLVYYHDLVVPVQPADYLLFICLKHLVTRLVTYPDVFDLAKKVGSR